MKDLIRILIVIRKVSSWPSLMLLDTWNEQPNYLEKYCVESMVAIYKSLDHYIYIYIYVCVCVCVCARVCVNIYLASSQIKLADKK